MKLRRRLVVAVAGLTLLTLGGAFAAVFVVVNRSQERQLDRALLAEAQEEAAEAKAAGGDRLMISDRPGPAANDVGPLTKYGVLYGPDGAVLTATATFGEHPPALSSLPQHAGRPFNLWFASEHLRCVLLPIEGASPRLFLLAAPRSDLDGDERFLGRAMTLVFLVAVIWAVLIATWVVRRLTRDHDAIAAVARRVAAGDHTARIEVSDRRDEVAQLARDVNLMIAQLSSVLVSHQQFIAHAAHELRSPLTTLYGELSHALRRARDAEGYRSAIEEALDGARRLKILAEDLLALARLSAVTDEPMERVDLKTAAHNAARQLGPTTAEERVHVRVQGADSATTGRPLDIERLLRNLIENAVRHSPSGATVELSLSSTGGRTQVRVRNDGRPISSEDRERIFDPFVKGMPEGTEGRPGVGLGLAIARQIARAHGGDVYLAEPRPEGTEFVVDLPTADEAATTQALSLSGPTGSESSGSRPV